MVLSQEHTILATEVVVKPHHSVVTFLLVVVLVLIKVINTVAVFLD